ncbi:MAG: DEAD/DEAH box helicase [Candidatus Doudnabacteria bacterium]|nr:DEAD/DEAH box helicase [Candidatus Doudnabacteria bacterium]
METLVDPQATFNNLGIAPQLLEILERLKFVYPTPIQQQAIPVAIEGKDLMGIAQTGTGKTLAFGVPMIQRLAQSSGKIKGLIILPTRELALQVDETLKKIGSTLGLKTAILIGGEAMSRQLKMLRQKPHIIIGTPGRLIDHLENKTINLSNTGILVLDEADRMLDMGFEPQIKKILQRIPTQRQTMLFSATMPAEIVKIAHSYMSLPLRVEVAPSGTTIHTVVQEVLFVDRQDKISSLRSVLSEYKGSVLVFTRTKHGAKKIARTVRDMGHSAAEIHSNRSLGQRVEALEGFKIGKYRVLVATDIAARGIDVTGIEMVINYDLPATAEDYVHRIGRTGRAGMTGHAISFATPDQRREVRNIERLIRKPLPISQSSKKLPQTEQDRTSRPFDRKKFGNNRRFSRHPRRQARPQARSRGRSNFQSSKGYFMKYNPANSE